MKEWPEDKAEFVCFEGLMEPLKEAIEFAYDLTRKNVEHDIPYSGYDIGRDERATCFSPDEGLSASHLEFALEDQGRNALDEILGIAMQLGIEQGRRIALDKVRDRIQVLTIGDKICDKLLSALGLEIMMSDDLRGAHEVAKRRRHETKGPMETKGASRNPVPPPNKSTPILQTKPKQTPK